MVWFFCTCCPASPSCVCCRLDEPRTEHEPAPQASTEVKVANFIQLNSQMNDRVNMLAGQIQRVEMHVRRGDKRAARAGLKHFFMECEAVLEEMSLPVEYIIAGANLGLFSGKGSLIRGRLPAAAFGAVVGWAAGQASIAKQERFIRALVDRAAQLDDSLRPPNRPPATTP